MNIYIFYFLKISKKFYLQFTKQAVQISTVNASS